MSVRQQDREPREPRADGESGAARGALGNPRRVYPFVAAAALLVLTAMGVAVAVHDLQTGGNAYVAGESRWSKAVQASIFHLDRYAETRQDQHLRAARDALETPLSDRRARLELEKPDADLAVARAHMEIGHESEPNLARMVRLFAVFRDWPEFSRALEAWAEADVWVVRLSELADELERLPDDAADQVGSIRAELALIHDTLSEKAREFSLAVSAGNRWLMGITLWVGLASIALLALLLIGLFAWAMRGVHTSQRRFWNTFEHAPVGMALINRDGELVEVNDALCRLLERAPGDLLGEPLAHFCDPRDRATLRRSITERAASGHALYNLESRYTRPDGSRAWASLSVAPLDAGMSGRELYVGVIEDISESRHLAAELAYQAAHDQLTGLPNRREFERELNRLLRELEDGPNRHALGVIDLDQFKIVNDTFGHLAGDALLVRLSERIHQCLRDGDVLARLDGDQFGFILRQCAVDTAREVGERLRATISDFGFSWEERPVNVSASIGIVEISGADRDAARLMQRVDLACYEAKDLGRDQVCIHARSQASSLKRREEMGWVHRINEALAADRLRFHGQLIGSSDGAHWRCELLVRLEDSDGELHTAMRFMEAAERYHVARAVDRWVVRSALQRIRSLRSRIPAIEHWHINLSGQSVDCETMLPEIRQAIEESAVDPGVICFEITESAAIHSLDEAREFFSALRELGCQVALDDFGKGLSTFDYLKQLPVDLVKIDGGFVRELAHSELDHAMVRSIYEVARIAGKQTIAESVESIELILRLKQIGIEYLQGHAIHNPEPLDRLKTPDPEESPLQHVTL